MDIKPIETEYNGYRFRSRLEARWAVFFDAAGIKYEYEPEGFTLKTGRKYLPDFWLPDFCIYVEIKPRLGIDDRLRQEKYDQQEELCRNFADEIGNAILLYRGNPWDDAWGTLYAFFRMKKGDNGLVDYQARFVDVSTTNHSSCPVLMVNDYSACAVVCTDKMLNVSPKVVHAHMIMYYYPIYAAYAVLHGMYEQFNIYGTDKWNKAKLKAKQARFEYGETPKVGC